MKVTLYTSALSSMAHQAVFLPWLRNAVALAPRSPDSVAVLVPQRTDAYFLKSLALSAGLGLWGVHFLTPGDLRDRLAAHLCQPAKIPLREHLRLLIATAAERVAASGDGVRTTSVTAAPDQLLKAIDMIGGAGWEFDEAGPPWLQPVVQEFRRLLDDAGWQMMHEADRTALRAVCDAAPCFTELLVLGFNALHWPLWPLLETAVRLAKNSTVCLTDPRPEAEDLDAAWIGTWENTFGSAEPVATDQLPALAETLNLPESHAARAQREAEPIRNIEFLVGVDTPDHARAIVAQALRYLADPSCGRLGVLFPAAGALSRRVAASLAELNIPHYDGLAHPAPGALEDATWLGWHALQESPRVPVLLGFLNAHTDPSFGGLTTEKAIFELQRTTQELLIDDLAVLAEYLDAHPREPSRILAEALRALPVLPESAPLGEYFRRSAKIFRSYGWSERVEALERFAGDWRESLDLNISRRTWLRWLREVLVSWQTRRAETGSHPYSRLHLIPYIHAESQAWTHLIATGLNEGHWPPTLEESGFLDEEEIAALNGEVRTLNRRAATQGRQGEGHAALRPGKTLCLGPAQRRALVERQFLNTLESASVALTASMQLHDEVAPERPLNPSEFFTRLHFCGRGLAVSQQTLVALQAETARWLGAIRFGEMPAPDPAAIRSTRTAFDARRDPDRRFGEYEFGLREAPPRPLRFSATQWESALFSPAQIFLAEMLGVSGSSDAEETPWALVQGIWVHRWLSSLTGTADPHTLVPLPSPTELCARVRAAADAFRGRVAAALAARRRALPDWWQSTWQEARSVAGRLSETVSRVQGRTHAATEWSIENSPLTLEDGTLFVRGRIDLLLSTADSLEDVWLVDYKTGNRKLPRKKDLADGDALQLALYVLALLAAGARQVAFSLLTPDAPLDQPQIQLADMAEMSGLWRTLLRMQETGVFGMLGALRPEFGFSRGYPLATLAIDEKILAAKWILTHPGFAPAEDDS